MDKELQKMWKVTTSGSFRTQVATDKDRHSFDDFEILVPYCDEEFILSFAMRLFPMYLKINKKIKANFEGLIKMHKDDYEEAEGEIPCIGKDIKKMSWEEIQWLACYKRLRDIPSYKSGDIRTAREKAYEEYERIVNGKRVFKNSQQLKKFKEDLLEKGRFPEEIDVIVNKSFNMISDIERPDNSYNFAKLPALIVK